VARLTALANDLLELSRLEAEPGESQYASTPSLIDEAMGSIDRARMFALPNDVDVSFALGDLDDAASYRLEPRSFARILDNLLTNAVNAVDKSGSVELGLDLRGDDLEVTVSDNGPGIPDSFLPRAFDRFTRPDDSRTATAGGSGLGLALVRLIAETAGGVASLENTGHGLTATVRLPKM